MERGRLEKRAKRWIREEKSETMKELSWIKKKIQ